MTQTQPNGPATATADTGLTKPSPVPDRRANRSQRGISLVESLTVTSIVAVLVGTGVPSLGDLRDRQRLQAVTSLVETDLQHARSLSVMRNQVLRLSFGTGAGQGCYVLHTGSTASQCRCGAEPRDTVCTGGAEALRSVTLDPSQRIRLQANIGAMAFEPHRGTVTPTGTVRVQPAEGSRVHLVVNVMGRVRACTPDGAAGWVAC